MKRIEKRRPEVQDPACLVRPLVKKLHAYVPGEQPKIKGLIKLNTNENPYPPSPNVLDAIRGALDGRLRLYPNPTADALREKLARFHHCTPENIIVGNGSDELLALATRAFVEPVEGRSRLGPAERLRDNRSSADRSLVQYFTPSYSLYPVLAAIHGADINAVPLRKDFGLPSLETGWKREAALTFLTTPNAPSGRGYTTGELEELCCGHRGVIVLDEAYVDFANQHALKLALRHPHVLVARTFSKAYSLCFLRVGYFVGNVQLIAALQKIRDSYNVNGLGQIAAQTTLDNLPYYRANFRRLIAIRESLSQQLRTTGFEVLPSQTNFIFVRPPGFPAKDWLDKLRRRKILVRWFDSPAVRDFLRITIGTESDMEALLKAVKAVLSSGWPAHRKVCAIRKPAAKIPRWTHCSNY